MPDLGLITCGAVPILLIAAGMWSYNLYMVLRYEKTTGTMIGYKTQRGGKGSGSQAEIVEFQLPNGEKITFTDKAYLNRWIEWGDHPVSVLYDPNQPTRARVNKFSTLYVLPIVLTLVGIGMLLSSFPMFQGPMQKLMDTLQKIIDNLPWWL